MFLYGYLIDQDYLIKIYFGNDNLEQQDSFRRLLFGSVLKEKGCILNGTEHIRCNGASYHLRNFLEAHAIPKLLSQSC